MEGAETLHHSAVKDLLKFHAKDEGALQIHRGKQSSHLSKVIDEVKGFGSCPSDLSKEPALGVDEVIAPLPPPESS